MKKLLPYAFMLCILTYCVLAADANIYEAKDFTKYPEQLAVVAERDLIKINWEDKEHQIHVRKIYYPEQKKVDLTAFIEGSEVPFYTTITSKTSLQLDFDQNNVYDLKVSIFNIIEENGTKYVALKLEKLEQEIPIITTQTVVDKNSPSLNSKIMIIILIGIILLGLGIWKIKLLLKTYRKMKKV